MGIEKCGQNQRFNYNGNEFNYENHIDESIANPNGKSINHKRDDDNTDQELCFRVSDLSVWV